MTIAPGVSHPHVSPHSSSSNLSNLLLVIVRCVSVSRYPVVWSNTILDVTVKVYLRCDSYFS